MGQTTRAEETMGIDKQQIGPNNKEYSPNIMIIIMLLNYLINCADLI